MFGDPVIGGVDAMGDDYQLHQQILEGADSAVANHEDLEPVTRGHVQGFVPDRTGVGVYVNLHHDGSLRFL